MLTRTAMKPLRRLSFLLLALCGLSLPFASSAQELAFTSSAAQPVTLYSAPWCGYCAKARNYLTDNGIAFREVDIESGNGKIAFAEIGGTGKGVPLLVAGERQIRGFSVATYDGIFGAR